MELAAHQLGRQGLRWWWWFPLQLSSLASRPAAGRGGLEGGCENGSQQKGASPSHTTPQPPVPTLSRLAVMKSTPQAISFRMMSYACEEERSKSGVEGSKR